MYDVCMVQCNIQDIILDNRGGGDIEPKLNTASEAFVLGKLSVELEQEHTYLKHVKNEAVNGEVGKGGWWKEDTCNYVKKKNNEVVQNCQKRRVS